MMFRLSLVLLVLAGALWSAPAHPIVPAAAEASPHFDAQAATNAWLATVPPDARAKSDAYFEGGYWLLLWDFLYGAAVSIFLLETKLSARLRDWAERITRFRFLQSFLYFAEFVIASAVLTFPLTVYEGFFREHQYGLSNQNFGGWLRDQSVALAVGLVFGGLAVAVIVAIIRKLPHTWHIWGTLAGLGFLVVGVIISPVFIAPLFNTYRSLQDTAIKDQILALAHQNGIPVNDVYEADESRQSKRVSANVSGIFGTDRITLNDNLLNRCSPEAVMSVMGHEMGHYVMHHIYTTVMFSSISLFLLLSVLRWGLGWSHVKFGKRWGIRDTTDLALFPAAVLIISFLSFLCTPINNTFTRTQEYEADIFGLNAARQPDGEAEVDLLLGEYRKLDPTLLEEWLFFDHPSGRTRIYAAMRWKAENLCLFDSSLTCANSRK